MRGISPLDEGRGLEAVLLVSLLFVFILYLLGCMEVVYGVVMSILLSNIVHIVILSYFVRSSRLLFFYVVME